MNPGKVLLPYFTSVNGDCFFLFVCLFVGFFLAQFWPSMDQLFFCDLWNVICHNSHVRHLNKYTFCLKTKCLLLQRSVYQHVPWREQEKKSRREYNGTLPIHKSCWQKSRQPFWHNVIRSNFSTKLLRETGSGKNLRLDLFRFGILFFFVVDGSYIIWLNPQNSVSMNMNMRTD